MKKVVYIFILLAITFLYGNNIYAVDVLHIDYYTRSDGVKVDSHYRTAPDGYEYNNLSKFDDKLCRAEALARRNESYIQIKAGVYEKLKDKFEVGVGSFCESLGALSPQTVSNCIQSTTEKNQRLADDIEEASQEAAWSIFLEKYYACIKDEILVCEEGYVLKNNECITYTEDCKRTFGDNVSYGVKGNNGSLCYCKFGYTWNESKTACIEKTVIPAQEIIEKPKEEINPPAIIQEEQETNFIQYDVNVDDKNVQIKEEYNGNMGAQNSDNNKENVKEDVQENNRSIVNNDDQGKKEIKVFQVLGNFFSKVKNWFLGLF